MRGYGNDHILAISLLITLPAYEIIFLGRVCQFWENLSWVAFVMGLAKGGAGW